MDSPVNNVLAFPGIFRGALDVRASTITERMEVAAGHAIVATISEEQLAPACQGRGSTAKCSAVRGFLQAVED